MEEKNYQELKQELNQLKKSQTRSKYKFNFLISIIAMLVLISATLAWFTLSNFASLDTIDMTISTAPGLYIDISDKGTDVTAWQKVLTKEMVDQALTNAGNPALDDQLLDPVTSNNGIAFTNRTGDTRNANDNSYIEFDVWFIATTDMWVHLSGDTVAINGTEYTTQCTTTETGAKADVVNALRASFQDTADPAPAWEPHKGAAVTGLTTFDVAPSTYTNDTRIFHLDKLTPKKITFRVWAEGEDPECDDDIQSAKVSIQMLFGGTDDSNVLFS